MPLETFTPWSNRIHKSICVRIHKTIEGSSWHSSLNLSVLLHAAAFISHLQWTAATYLSVKYNITHPLLTYLTIILLNYQLSNNTIHPTILAITNLQKWSVTKVLRRRMRIFTELQKQEGYCPIENLKWTVLIRTYGSVRSIELHGWCTHGKGGADLIPAWWHLWDRPYLPLRPF